ncbi:hypothetical protein MBEHAL_2686 [Halarchaeum acidiphilum MH1-52-1]|uniref:Uncharacterized protein n=1 Tax=Halarchaeum acidiphilum MH1-52-1 TaxID=1261545 RepID=U2YHF8_9EURY|nr:hypothetical protein MBEHAL_2686 [Halarchaeum acidiphilum MH1-52-1]
MRDAREVVVDPGLEVEHRPAAIVARRLARMGRVDHPERDEVAQRGVLVLDVRLDPEDHLAGVVLAVDHRLELVADDARVLLAVRAGLPSVLQLGEVLARTATRVRAAAADELAGVLVVGLHPIGGRDHFVRLETEVVDVVEDRVVGVEVGTLRLRVGVVETDEHPAVVAFLVRPDDGGHPGVPEMPRPVRVRRAAHPHLVVVVGVREVGQRVLLALVLGFEFFEALRRDLLETRALLGLVEVVHLVHDGRDDARHLVAVLAELWVRAHQRAENGADLRVAPVFQRVEQRVRLGLPANPLAEVLVHTRPLMRVRGNSFGFAASSARGRRSR